MPREAHAVKIARSTKLADIINFERKFIKVTPTQYADSALEEAPRVSLAHMAVTNLSSGGCCSCLFIF